MTIAWFTATLPITRSRGVLDTPCTAELAYDANHLFDVILLRPSAPSTTSPVPGLLHRPPALPNPAGVSSKQDLPVSDPAS